jgi:Domain of unknown function (DUF3336)/Patatin-like phospholipase
MHAQQLDRALVLNDWKNVPKTTLADDKLLVRIVQKLRRYQRDNDIEELCHVLQHSACKNNVGGIETESLYSQTFYGTKTFVEEYVHETIESLDFVAKSPDMDTAEKAVFFKETCRSFGHTALCLSGGAALAFNHLGVIKALFEHNLLPRVITGTSAGSVMGNLWNAVARCTRY